MPVRRRTEPLQIDCLQTAEELQRLQSPWQALERRDPQCSPFNTWDWNWLWWQHCSLPDDRLAVLRLRDRQRVVAIVPLYLHSGRMCRIIPVRIMQFIGSGADTSPDYLGLIALPEWRELAQKQALAYLKQVKGWTKLLLSDMRADSSLAEQALRFVEDQPGTALTPTCHIIQRSSLPDSFEAWRASLSRKRRKQINHRRNRLDQAGRWALSICASRQELDQAMDALIRLHRLRWQSKGEAGAFRTDDYVQFHRAVIERFFSTDALWLATLELDGQIIGVQYIFLWRGELLFMQSGYSPDHESLSPGHVLFTYVIERAIEQGVTAIDMLKGQYSYKSVYAREQSRTVDLGLLRPGLRGCIAALRERWRRKAIDD